ncbi:CLUMA_CG007673, isoform A [Clunio marinus]|uniref:Eukaryotic translation initiation factor 2A n=1 Tax=Clunio marinus TaxID=568069 RepID=A0A1J1I309_9DIPT|nr:CLUMA_CG007673, isoform A [Clunio marinus]
MLNFAVRSGTGLEIWNIQNKDGTTASSRQFKPFFKEAKSARAMTCSSNFFAYGNSVDGVKVYNSKMELKFVVPRTKAYIIKFSPKESFLIIYEIFASSKENSDNPNLFFYDTSTGEEKCNFVMKRHSEWEPYFAQDESFFAIMLNNEICFYENFVKTSQKLSGKVGGFSVSPGASHVAVYIRGEKGSPSMCRLFKYPNINTNPVSSKTFAQADKVEMIWNNKGTGCLIMTSMDVDSTGVSYYGKQALHFLATSGDSYSVPLSAEGPIHAVSWSPKSNQFIVVYGYIPAKTTLFNFKCDSVFDFGTGIRNSIYFNDFGNLVLFGGFGNLKGQIEVWDLIKKKQVSMSLATDTTLVQWAPSGDLYFTATTAPRLRQGNGFKIWHYSGALLFEMMWPEKQELLELMWQKSPENTFKEMPINYDKVEGVQSVQKQASDKKYVPPNVRAFGEDSTSSGAPAAQGPIPGLPPGYTSSKSQSASKGRYNQRRKPQSSNSATEGKTDKDDDDRKKSSGIKKKLKDIKILKEKLEKGEKLDKNQLNKITLEADLNKELAALKLS